ncbi:MAG TPA: hypothetical protein VD999_05105 [Vitreimonas sp.]|nr:hypothetical protein [Vitreimonas sp.]
MPKRTKAQKLKTAQRREHVGASETSFQWQAAQPMTSKPVVSSTVSPNRFQLGEGFFGYSPSLIWDDLRKTVIVVSFVLGLLAVITWYIQ